MTAVNLNSYPYFDDHEPSKGFHKIAFVPGRPIQARELTQLQSILQEQIKRVGKHFFKNGTVIIPGHTYYDNSVYAIRLNDTNAEGVQTDSFVLNMIDKTFKNSNGTTAYVSFAEVSNTIGGVFSPAVIYVKFTGGGTSGKLEFVLDDVLEEVDNPGVTLKVTSTYTPTSPASIVSITEGVYYANGYFVQVLKQTISLSSSTNTPTAKIGLLINESIVTETDDASLYDNSVGSNNYTAPGAHRVKIALELSTKTPAEESITSDSRVDFILLYSIVNGEIQYEKSSDTEYSKFEAMLAKRTFEESGNYIVDSFDISAIDYRDNNRGTWSAQTAYLEGDVITYNGNKYFAVVSGVSGVSAPSHTSGTISDGGVDWANIKNSRDYENVGRLKNNYQLGIASPLALEQKADDSFSIEVANGIAYVNGFRSEIKGVSRKVVDKARNVAEEFNVQITAPNPITVYASSVVSGVSVSPVAGLPDIDLLTTFNIYTNINGTGTVIGTCRIRSVEQITAGLYSDETVKVAIFDIKISDPINTGFLYNAVSLKSGAADCIINLSRRVIPLVGTHESGTAGNANKVYGILSNYDEELRVGGYITDGNRTDKVYKVTAITSDVEISIQQLDGTAAAPAWISGTPLFISVVAFKSGSVSSITQLPKSYVKTLRSVDVNGNNNTTYRVIKQISFTSNGAGGYTYTCPAGEKLLSTGHLLSRAGTTTNVVVLDAWVSPDGTTLTIPSAQLVASTLYRLHAKISKSGVAAAERSKVLKSKTVYIFPEGVYHDSAKTTAVTWIPEPTKNNYKIRTPINLGYADVIRINSIKVSGNPTIWADAGSTEIGDNFTFNDGQRAEFYDYATITNVKSEINAPLMVTFDYYEHTAGDYFTVDSYQNTPYALIPSVFVNGTLYNLRDCIDFRIRVNDSSGANYFQSVGNTMQSNEAFNFDYSYYLGRKDLLILKSGGELNYLYGAPAINPIYPTITSNEGMVLAKVDVAPYTNNAEKEVTISVVGNKNYTMKEIEKIDNRVKNVEEYVSLSLLEKDTANYKITDKYGLDRLKNGFFVVDFKDSLVHFNTGAYYSGDYRCTVLPEYKAMAPNRVSYDLPLFIDATGNSVGTVVDMSIYPTFLATLKPTQTVEFSLSGIPNNGAKPMFSTKLNVNPFNAFSFFGTMSVFPSVDTWQSSIISSETLYTDGLSPNTGTSLTSSNFDAVASNFRNSWVTRVNNFNLASISSAIRDSEINAGVTSTTNVFVSGRIASSNSTANVFVNSGKVSPAMNASVFDNMTSGSTLTQVHLDTASWTTQNLASTLTLAQQLPAAFERSEEDKFIRSRVFVVVAKKLMPNVDHIFEFDNVSQNSSRYYVKQPIKLIISNVSSTIEQDLKFYDEVSAYSNSDSNNIAAPKKTSGMYRSFNEWSGNDYEGAVNGQLVRFGGSYYGLMVGWEKIDATSYAVYIFPTLGHNAAYAVSGTSTLEIMNESSSGSVYSVSTKSNYTVTVEPMSWNTSTMKVKTTNLGNLFALVLLQPNYFRTGEKQISLERDPYSNPSTSVVSYNILPDESFVVSNSSSPITNSTTSSAKCTYTATGITSYFKESFIYKINAIPTVTVGTTRREDIWFDPLAQTFMIKKSATVSSDYVMLSGVTMWFASAPLGTNHTVSIQIINAINGYPATSLVHPWATIELLPHQVTVASVSNGYAPGLYNFATPVPLKTNTEYAIRIVAPTSNGYEVWTSKLNEECVNYPGQLITSQQADGSLFLSQNSSTWSAEQYSDLAATLHFYNYNTTTSSSIKMRTDIGNKVVGYNGIMADMTYCTKTVQSVPPEFRTLNFNPFGRNGINNKVKVYHQRHGLYSNTAGKSFVKLILASQSDMDAVTTSIHTKINGYFFRLEEVKANSYTLDLSTRYYYNSGIGAFSSEATPDLNTILTSGSGLWGKDSWMIQAAGKFDSAKLNANVLLEPIGTTMQFTKKFIYLDSSGIHGETTYDEIIPGIDYTTEKQYVAFVSGELKTQINAAESDYLLTSDESEHGINFRIHASTSNKWTTPILHLPSLSLSLGKSMHTPSLSTDCVANTTDFTRLINAESCIFTAADKSITLPISTNLVTSFIVGAILKVSGTVSNNNTFNITKIDSTARKIFVDGVLVNETVNAVLHMGVEYISEASPSNGTAMSKYISKEVSLSTPASSLHINVAMTTPAGSAIEFWYRSGNSNLDNETWIKQDIFLMQTNDSTFFYDNEFEINNISEFTRFQVKFIFTSTSSNYPAVKDLRVIALI